jgi:hypothetical protein
MLTVTFIHTHDGLTDEHGETDDIMAENTMPMADDHDVMPESRRSSSAI